MYGFLDASLASITMGAAAMLQPYWPVLRSLCFLLRLNPLLAVEQPERFLAEGDGAVGTRARSWPRQSVPLGVSLVTCGVIRV